MTVQLITPIANPHKFLLTTDQYHLMHKAGVFGDSDRLELVNGCRRFGRTRDIRA